MAKPCRYQLPGTDTWMSESEFKKALNDGLIDKYVNDGVISIRNFKPKAVTAPVATETAVETPATPVAETKEVKIPKNKKERIDAALKGNMVYHRFGDTIYESTPEQYNAALKEISETGNISNASNIGKEISKNQAPDPVLHGYAPNLEKISQEDAQYELGLRTKETIQEAKPKTEPLVETKAPEVKQESPLDEELSSAIIDMENIQEEIEIEKGNIKEEKERIKEEKAKVRASKMSRAEKQDKLEDLDEELKEYIENAEAAIEYAQMDLKDAKSRVKKIENRKAKEASVVETKAEPVQESKPVASEKESAYDKNGSFTYKYLSKILEDIVFSAGPRQASALARGLRKAGFDISFSFEQKGSSIATLIADSLAMMKSDYDIFTKEEKAQATKVLSEMAKKRGIEIESTQEAKPVETKTEPTPVEPVAKEESPKYETKEASKKMVAPGRTKQAFDRNFTIEISADGKTATVQGEAIETADGRKLTPPKETAKITTNVNGERVAITSKGDTVYLDRAKEAEVKEVEAEGKTSQQIRDEYMEIARQSNGDYAIVYSRTGDPLVYKKNRRTNKWQGLTDKGEWIDANENRNAQANDAVNYTRKDRKMVKMSIVKNGVSSVDDFVYDFNDNTWKKLSEDGSLSSVGKELAAKAEERFVLENPKRAPKTKEEIKQRISDIIDGAKADEGIAMSSLIPIPPKYWNKILDLAKEAMFKGVDFSFAINDAAKKVFREAVKNKEITKDKSIEYIDAINDNIYNDDIPELTAIKKELTSDLAREIASKGFANMKPKETFELAEKAIKSGDIDPEVLAKDIQESPRPITDFETAILMYAKTSASTELKELYDKSKGLDKNSEAYRTINAKIKLLNDKILMYDVSGLMGGSLNASALSIRRYVMNAEYDLILPQIEKIYADNDQEMPEGLAEKIKDALKELRRLNREIEKLKADSDALKEDEAVKNIAEEVKKPSKGKTDTNKNSVSSDGKITVSQQSIRNAVINGATEIEQVVDAVRNEVLAKFPDATDRQIRDAISNYGREVKKSADEITQEINRIKGVGRMISQLEDIKKQLASGRGKFLNNKLKKPAERMLNQRQSELKRAIKEAMANIPVTDQQFEDFKKYKLDAYKKRLADRTAELKEKIKNKDFVSKKQTRVFELDEEARKLEEEKRKIVDEFDYEKTKAELSTESRFKKTGRLILDALNLQRGLTASIDVSAPFRQGIVLLSTQNPKDSGRQIGKMLGFFAKPGSYEEWLNGLKASKEYSLFKEAGLFISEQSPKLEAKEELFANNLANKIPIIGDKLIPGTDKKGLQAYKRSEYAYAGFLNMMRAETFMQGVKTLREQGYTMENNPKVYKDWATYVNSATGRGKLNLGNQNLAVGLSTIFFSPSLIKARLEILGLSWGYYTKLSPAVRAMAVKRTLSFMGMMSTFLGLTALILSLNDDDDEDKRRVELDPRSSDFGKIITKDTRIDITGGTAIYYRTLVQVLSQAKKNMTTQQIEELGQKYGDQTSMDVAEQFFINKLTPFAAAVYKEYGKTEYEKQKDELEQESKDNVFNRAGVPLVVQKLIVPMWMNDAEEIVKSNGPALGTLLVGGSLFGLGVQVIKPKFKAAKSNNSMDFNFDDSDGIGDFNDAGGFGDFNDQKGMGDFN